MVEDDEEVARGGRRGRCKRHRSVVRQDLAVVIVSCETAEYRGKVCLVMLGG